MAARCFMIPWCLLILSLVHLSEEVAYLLSAPLTHVALSGDVTVSYVFSPDEDEVVDTPIIQLFDLGTQSVITSKPVFDKPTGRIEAECSLFDHSGQIVARLRDGRDGRVLNTSNIIQVSWPSYTIKVKKNHEAFSRKLKVAAVTTNNLCQYMDYAKYEIEFVLIYQGEHGELENREPVLDGRVPVVETAGFLKERVRTSFRCDAADQAGLYYVALRSQYKQSTISTAFISVLPSTSYSLSFNVNSTALCNKTETGIAVSFSKPNCTLKSDNLRLYADSSPNFSRKPLQSNLRMISEQLASEGSITFGCNTFRNSEFSGYCFVYVVRSRSGAVTEQAKQCLPTRQTGPIVDGEWGTWSEWGECTATCGITGEVVRHRSRLCDNPPPSNGGIPCEGGTAVDTKECKVNLCPKGDRVVKERDATHATTPGQPCNQILHAKSGEFIASPLICPSGAAWLIEVPESFRIRLSFQSFNLYLPQEYVRVRDGGDTGASVLAFHTGQIIPEAVTSTGNRMFIEYEVYEFGKPPERGFTASYESIDAPEPPLTPPVTVGGYTEEEDTSGFTDLHRKVILATGISLLVLLLLLSLIMTIIIRFKEEKHHPANIQPVYAGPLGSFTSTVNRSNQRLYGLQGHSTTSPSEHSHQSVSKRGFPDGNGTSGDKSMFIGSEGSNLQYLPETSLVSSSYHTEREITPISELPSPYHEETGPKWPVPKKNVSSAQVGELYGSIDDRQSFTTDKNTIHLTNRTPSEFAMRGYSAHGSHKGSRNSMNDSVRSGSKDKKRRKIKANVENTDNSSPYISPEGQLTPLGLNELQKRSRTDYNRSPEGAENPELFLDGGRSPDARIGYSSLLRKKDKQKEYVDPVGGNQSDIIKSPRRFPSSRPFYSDRSVTSPDSNPSVSGSNNPTSPRGRHHHHHSDKHRHGERRRRSPDNRDSYDMKDLRSSGRHRRKKSPSSPRSRRDLTSPRSDRSGSSRGSARRSKSGASSKSSKHGSSHKNRHAPQSPKKSYSHSSHSRAAIASPETPITSLSPTSEPSPIHLPQSLSAKQNRQQMQQVFLSDESLMTKLAAARDQSGAESSRSGRSIRNLPNTPPSSGSSPTKRPLNKRVYSDKSLSSPAEEPEFDDFMMPSMPGGAYFLSVYEDPILSGLDSPKKTPNKTLHV